MKDDYFLLGKEKSAGGDSKVGKKRRRTKTAGSSGGAQGQGRARAPRSGSTRNSSTHAHTHTGRQTQGAHFFSCSFEKEKAVRQVFVVLKRIGDDGEKSASRKKATPTQTPTPTPKECGRREGKTRSPSPPLPCNQRAAAWHRKSRAAAEAGRDEGRGAFFAL